jgi:hypothetical protein
MCKIKVLNLIKLSFKPKMLQLPKTPFMAITIAVMNDTPVLKINFLKIIYISSQIPYENIFYYFILCSSVIKFLEK